MGKGGVSNRISNKLRRIADACSLRVAPDIREDLLDLQYRRVGVTIPLIYFAMAIIAAVASSASVGHFSPTYHVALPGFFLATGLIRSLIWYRRRNDRVSHKQKIKRLRSTFILALLISFVGSAWTIDAYLHTEETRRVLAPIFLFMITFASAICLTSLPRTAVAILAVAMLPSCLLMIAAQDIGIRAMGIGFTAIALMLSGMIAHNFAEMVSGLKLRKELKILSETDSLTGLANRRSFEQKFAHAMHTIQVQSGDQEIDVTLIDLDGFKNANDKYGHAAGDAVLQEVAARLRLLCADANCISRLGGDEFAVISLAGGNDGHVREREEAIRTALSLPYMVDGNHIPIGASIGNARSRQGSRKLSQLMKLADGRLYAEKCQGEAGRQTRAA